MGILRRESTQTDEGEGITALSHREITEVYYVLSGSGILETGGDGEGDREFPPASSLVKELVGPTDVRTVKNGETINEVIPYKTSIDDVLFELFDAKKEFIPQKLNKSHLIKARKNPPVYWFWENDQIRRVSFNPLERKIKTIA